MTVRRKPGFTSLDDGDQSYISQVCTIKTQMNFAKQWYSLSFCTL